MGYTCSMEDCAAFWKNDYVIFRKKDRLDRHVTLNKSDSESQVLDIFIHMWNVNKHDRKIEEGHLRKEEEGRRG